MWFEVTKPLFVCDGKVPREVAQVSESWLVFAIPKMQVEEIHQA